MPATSTGSIWIRRNFSRIEVETAGSSRPESLAAERLSKEEIVKKKWKCTLCGYIHTGEAPPEKCPVCGASSDKFVPYEPKR